MLESLQSGALTVDEADELRKLVLAKLRR